MGHAQRKKALKRDDEGKVPSTSGGIILKRGTLVKHGTSSDALLAILDTGIIKPSNPMTAAAQRGSIKSMTEVAPSFAGVYVGHIAGPAAYAAAIRATAAKFGSLMESCSLGTSPMIWNSQGKPQGGWGSVPVEEIPLPVVITIELQEDCVFHADEDYVRQEIHFPRSKGMYSRKTSRNNLPRSCLSPAGSEASETEIRQIAQSHAEDFWEQYGSACIFPPSPQDGIPADWIVSVECVQPMGAMNLDMVVCANMCEPAAMSMGWITGEIPSECTGGQDYDQSEKSILKVFSDANALWFANALNPAAQTGLVQGADGTVYKITDKITDNKMQPAPFLFRPLQTWQDWHHERADWFLAAARHSSITEESWAPTSSPTMSCIIKRSENPQTFRLDLERYFNFKLTTIWGSGAEEQRVYKLKMSSAVFSCFNHMMQYPFIRFKGRMRGNMLINSINLICHWLAATVSVFYTSFKRGFASK